MAWTHLGRVWTNGEPLLAVDAGQAAAWRSDRFPELIDLGVDAVLIPVGDGIAAIIRGDGTINDEGWIEVFADGQGRLAFVHASGLPYSRVLDAALAYPASHDLDSGTVPLPSGELMLFSVAMDGAGQHSGPLVRAAPGPTPLAYQPVSSATPAAEVLAGLAVSVGSGVYRLLVRWSTDLPHNAAFARWLLVPEHKGVPVDLRDMKRPLTPSSSLRHPHILAVASA